MYDFASTHYNPSRLFLLGMKRPDFDMLIIVPSDWLVQQLRRQPVAFLFLLPWDYDSSSNLWLRQWKTDWIVGIMTRRDVDWTVAGTSDQRIVVTLNMMSALEKAWMPA